MNATANQGLSDLIKDMPELKDISLLVEPGERKRCVLRLAVTENGETSTIQICQRDTATLAAKLRVLAQELCPTVEERTVQALEKIEMALKQIDRHYVDFGREQLSQPPRSQ